MKKIATGFPRHGNFFADSSTPWKIVFHAVEKYARKNTPKAPIPSLPPKTQKIPQKSSKTPIFTRF
jgi:hypothetical protein